MKPSKSILILDDDESYRAILRHHLEAQGHQVLEAEDGVLASHIVSEVPLHLLILDMVMPNSEGLETIFRLRQDGVRTKILAVSGAGLGSVYLQAAVKMGANASVEKTRPIAELLKAIESLLEDGPIARASGAC